MANWAKSIICDKDIILSLRYPSHKKIIPSQIHILEIFLRLFDQRKITNPNHQIHTMTRARLIISYFNQMVPSRTSVKGAQTLAPMMTHTALWSQITPAQTKARMIKETTLLLCNIAVTNAQVKIDLKVFWVKFLSIFLKVFVVKFFIASSKTYIPKRNIHSHQISNQILVQDMHIILITKDQDNYTQNWKFCKFCPLKNTSISI